LQLKILLLAGIVAAIFISPLFVSEDVFATEIIQRPLSPWGCPDTSAPGPSEDKDGDGKLDRLHIHIEDEHGNDFQVWCLDHSEYGDYGYYSSATGRNDTKVAACKLICGKNDGKLIVSDGAQVILNGTSNGTKTYVVNGTIIGYNHTNWVPHDEPRTTPHKGQDHHFLFNYSSHVYQHDTTRINATTGEHHIIRTESKMISAGPSQEQEFFAFTDNLARQSFPAFEGVMEIGSETLVDPQFVILAKEVFIPKENGGPETFIITHPSQVEIEEIMFDVPSKSLLLMLPDHEHEKYVNLSIPKKLLDHADPQKFIVLVDEMPSDYTETATMSHRTLLIPVTSESGSVMITGTTAIPEFGSAVMIILTISIISIIVLSSKTKISLR